MSNCRSATIRSLCRSRAWRGTVLIVYRGGRSSSLYCQVGQPLGQALEVGHGVDPEDEPDAVLVPAVQVPGLGEVGVAPEGDLAEPRPAAQGGGLVEVDVGVLVRGPVAAAVDQVQRLGGVGQRDDQRVVAPGPVVGDVHPLLAPAVAWGRASRRRR